MIKIALLLWFAAFVLSLFARGSARSWMMRIFVGGFCILLLGFFLKLISRIL